MDALHSALANMREVVTRNKSRPVMMPIATVENADPDEIVLRLGEWVNLEVFEGMRCMLTHEVPELGARYVLCETIRAVDCGPHRHPGHAEEVIMMEGAMEDKSSGQMIYPGMRYRVTAGETHWPVFPGPALFMVIFRKLGGTTEGDDRRA